MDILATVNMGVLQTMVITVTTYKSWDNPPNRIGQASEDTTKAPIVEERRDAEIARWGGVGGGLCYLRSDFEKRTRWLLYVFGYIYTKQIYHISFKPL